MIQDTWTLEKKERAEKKRTRDKGKEKNLIDAKEKNLLIIKAVERRNELVMRVSLLVESLVSHLFGKL